MFIKRNRTRHGEKEYESILLVQGERVPAPRPPGRPVKGEKLKEQIKKGTEGGSLDSVEIDPAEYPEYLKRAYWSP